MKTSQLILNCFLIFFLADSTLADESEGSNWRHHYTGNNRQNYSSTSDVAVAGLANLPPSISGIPASTATVGQIYTFSPSASDPERDPLIFRVINLPEWASFNNFTGTLSGTPTAANIGLYVDIIITVSDGNATTFLDPFNIMVNRAADPTGMAELSWGIPTQRSDGSSLLLSEIDGYRVYMGEASDNLSMIIDLNDGAVTTHTVRGLAAGIYYFAVTAYDMDGNESSFSSVANKAIM